MSIQSCAHYLSNRVIRAPGEHLCDFHPLVSELRLRAADDTVVLRRKGLCSAGEGSESVSVSSRKGHHGTGGCFPLPRCLTRTVVAHHRTHCAHQVGGRVGRGSGAVRDTVAGTLKPRSFITEAMTPAPDALRQFAQGSAPAGTSRPGVIENAASAGVTWTGVRSCVW